MHILKILYAKLNFGSNIIAKILSALLVLLVFSCASTVLLQVINRYIIVKISDISLSFTDELSRWLMVIITYLVVGICVREGSMAQVDLIYSRLGPKGRLFLYLITRMLMAAVLFIGIYYGLRVMRAKAFMLSSMLEIPGWLLYSPPFVGSVLMSYEWLTELIGVLAGELEPFAAGAKRGFPHHEEPPEQIPM
ncbi:MAG: TRAP transporter small permease subunit [Planctomycetes bacterium]|nr:TRAP transporter small permease subunit [Planctomycetota bacterium]